MKVHEALIEVMRGVPAVPKDDRNETQNFSFRGIDSVLNAVGPKLRQHGVIVLPTMVDKQTSIIEVGRNKTPMRWVLLTMNYRFVGPEGDTLDLCVPGEAMDAGDKAFSKAMSVAMRTALLQALALPTDEPDPDSEAHEMSAVPKSEAELARDSLRELCVEFDLKPAAIAKRYRDELGINLGTDEDVARLVKFTDELRVERSKTK